MPRRVPPFPATRFDLSLNDELGWTVHRVEQRTTISTCAHTLYLCIKYHYLLDTRLDDCPFTLSRLTHVLDISQWSVSSIALLLRAGCQLTFTGQNQGGTFGMYCHLCVISGWRGYTINQRGFTPAWIIAPMTDSSRGSSSSDRRLKLRNLEQRSQRPRTKRCVLFRKQVAERLADYGSSFPFLHPLKYPHRRLRHTSRSSAPTNLLHHSSVALASPHLSLASGFAICNVAQPNSLRTRPRDRFAPTQARPIRGRE